MRNLLILLRQLDIACATFKDAVVIVQCLDHVCARGVATMVAAVQETVVILVVNRPCVDCGRVTGCFCDWCYARDSMPREQWMERQKTPLCTTAVLYGLTARMT